MEERFMESSRKPGGINRRKVLQLAGAATLAQIAPPLIISARGEQSVKLGLDNPLTGVYAATGKNELNGCQLAIEQINAKGGILGRPAELLIEDSSSGDAGTAVQKARKLIDRDKVNFLLGNVNSGLSLAMAQVSNEKRILHIVPGGHTDAITGATCHWNVFRVCNTTRMLTNAIAKSLMDRYGKKMYFITSDYAFGHTLQEGYDANLKQYGGTKLGEDLTPLGTTDFSSYLIKAQATNPDVLVFLMNGDDLLNALKQAVQFGLDKRIHLAGANTELEVLEGLPPEARIGDWSAGRPAAGSAHRRLGGRVVPHPAGRAARRRIRGRDQEEDRPRAHRAYLVRLCRHLELRAGGEPGEVARRGQDGEGAQRHGTAAGGCADAGQDLLPCRPEPADRFAVCRQCAGEGHATG